MKDLTYGKAVLVTLSVVAVALAYSALTSAIGLKHPWIPFLAFTVWSGTGMKMTEAPGIWVGSALGLIISYLMATLPELYGAWAMALPVTMIVLVISFKIREQFSLIANFGLFTFLTLGSADIFMEHAHQLLYLKDLAVGAIVFWLLPWIWTKLQPPKKALV